MILQVNAEPAENLWRFHAVQSAKADIEPLGSENAIELITGAFTSKITPTRGV